MVVKVNWKKVCLNLF